MQELARFGVDPKAAWPIAIRGTKMSASTTGAAVRSLSDLRSPRGLPLLGNALQLNPSRLHLIFEEWTEQFGSAFAIGLGRYCCKSRKSNDPKNLAKLIFELLCCCVAFQRAASKRVFVCSDADLLQTALRERPEERPWSARDENR
jgi:hypothetical protein